MTILPEGFLRRPSSSHALLLIPVFLLCVLFSTAASPFVYAQDSPVDETSEDVVRVETNLVTVPVFITDAKGRRIHGLAQGDFSLSDEGQPVEVAYFAAGAERVALTFLLDASGSTRDIITQQRETALALLARFGASSRVAVIRFTERPELIVPFTKDEERVRDAFNLPLLRNRRTAIFDAALAAVRFYDTARSDRTERRIIILISDGLDTVSTSRASAVVKAARESGASVYVIHLPLFAFINNRLAPRPTTRGFRDLATQTGGQFFTVGDEKTSLSAQPRYDLGPVFQAIAEDLRGQYVLGFYAKGTTGGGAVGSGPRRLKASLTSERTSKFRLHALRESYQRH